MKVVWAAAFLLTLLVMSLPSNATSTDDEPALPTELGGYSHLTGDVSDSPPGRAVALFQHGWGVEFLDFPQAVVLGAGGDVYRRLDVAEDRAGPETQGDPAPMLLSPDGLRVAVGDHDTSPADLVVVDLRTGATTRHALPDGRSVRPVAWSPDGRTVAFLTNAEPTNPHLGRVVSGDLGLVELGVGEVTTVPGGANVVAAAFSPDGTELALQHAGRAGRLEVVGLDGRSRRVLDAPGGVLTGPEAWSPDGRLLALTNLPTGSPDDIVFVDATGEDGPTPEPVPAGRGLLGWTSPDEVLVLVDTTPAADPRQGGPERHEVRTVSLADGQARQVMRMEDLESYGVGRFQLATGLLGDLRVVTPSDLDRGLWPWPLRIVVAVVVALAAVILTRLVLNRQPWLRKIWVSPRTFPGSRRAQGF